MSVIGRLRLALAILVVLPPIAGAHASLVRASPPARAVVAESPPRVDLWFNERLESAYSTVSVWSASGARVDRQDALVARDDPKRLSVGVHTLPPGAYTVRYRVLSVDGHVIESSFTFTVGLRGSR